MEWQDQTRSLFTTCGEGNKVAIYASYVGGKKYTCQRKKELKIMVELIVNISFLKPEFGRVILKIL